jgi:hypothetical protein
MGRWSCPNRPRRVKQPGRPIDGGRPAVVTAGDLFLTPPSARYTLASRAAAPVVVVVVTICPVGITPADVNHTHARLGEAAMAGCGEPGGIARARDRKHHG